jgi:hypothetical protein
VDNEAPVTSENYDALWHNSDITITLSVDDGTGIGVSSTNNISYRINGDSVKTVGGSGQPKITFESATNTLEYWSVDDVGNEELPHKVLNDIKLDKQGPIDVEWQLQPQNITEDSIGDVDITIRITDPLSGISQTTVPEFKYKLDDESYSPYAAMTLNSGSPPDQYWDFTVPEPTPDWNVYRGTNLTMMIKATDQIGNVRESAEYRELIFNIIEAPVCNLTAPSIEDVWYNGLVDLSAEVQDSDGEVVTVAFQYSLDSTDGVSGDGTWTDIGTPDTSEPYSIEWNTVSDGLVEENNVWVRARAMDDDNIFSSFSVASIKIDNKEAELLSVDWSPSKLSAIHSDPVTVSIQISDSGSGLDFMEGSSPNTTLFPAVSYKIGEGSPTSYLSLAPLDSEFEKWQYSIPVPAGGWSQFSGSELVTWFRLYDRVGNEHITGEHSINISALPFIIEHTPIITAQEGDKITLKANVTGGSGKFTPSAVIFYKYDLSDNYQELDMNQMILGGRSTFSYDFTADMTIPRPYPFTIGQPTLYYYIKASEGTLHTTTHPSVNPDTIPHMINITSNIKPEITHQEPDYAMIGEPIIIEVSVMDESTDLMVTLYYKEINVTTYETSEMQLKGTEGNIRTYIETIPAQNVEGEVVYYFEVYDGEFTVEAPVEFITQPFSVRVFASDIPRILHEPLKKVFVGNRIHVSAVASDNNGLETVKLFYKIGSMIEFKILELALKEGDSHEGTYIVEIPTQERAGTIYYYIEAWDGLNTGTYPKVNASNQPLVLVVDEYPNLIPEILGFSPEPSAQLFSGESKEFNVSAIDPDGDSKAMTYKWYVDNMPMPDSDSPEFTFKSGSKDKGMFSVRVQVMDEDGGAANFSWTLDIKDPEESGSESSDKLFGPFTYIIAAALVVMIILFWLFVVKRKITGRKEPESDLEEPVSGLKQRPKSGKKTKTREIKDGEMDEDGDDHSIAPVGPLPIPMKYDVSDLFLIHANGNLISHIGTTSRRSSDKEILSGMLTAIQDFIKDGFSEGTGSPSDEWYLDNLKFGDRNVFIERGEYMYIAAVLKGDIGNKLRNELHDALKTIDLQYSHVLKKWDGRLDKLNGINEILGYKFNILKPKTKFGPGPRHGKGPKSGPGQRPSRDRHR